MPRDADARADGARCGATRASLTDLSQQKILRAAYSERQLDEVMVDFWFNHFNVFAGKGQTRSYLTEYERDAIRPHVARQVPRSAGRDRAESGDAVLSGQLAERRSRRRAARPPRPQRQAAATSRIRTAPAAVRMPPARTARWRPAAGQRRIARPRGLNENYARELMELHTLGVDGGYTQKDVQEVARAFTGWTIAQSAARRRIPVRAPHARRRGEDRAGTPYQGRRRQDAMAKQVLDILAAHPSTARFIATKLARRFVSDDPPAALVDRAAARFRDTGGDIREVVRTIVTSPEFFADAAYRAKVKTPFEFVVSAVRATGPDVVNALPLVQALRDLGMPLYQCQPPTGYADRADAWVNTGALLEPDELRGRADQRTAPACRRLRGPRAAAPERGSACTRVGAQATSAGNAQCRRRRHRRRILAAIGVSTRDGGESVDAVTGDRVTARLP